MTSLVLIQKKQKKEQALKAAQLLQTIIRKEPIQ
tara:strand:- start:235 stop:336 length:102 start_codon:yes stop_codon:yes gene_type:complete